jgi:hypothetical protein
MASALRMYEALGFVRDQDLAPIRSVPYGRYVLPLTPGSRRPTPV